MTCLCHFLIFVKILWLYHGKCSAELSSAGNFQMLQKFHAIPFYFKLYDANCTTCVLLPSKYSYSFFLTFQHVLECIFTFSL